MTQQQYIGNEKTHNSMVYGLSLALAAHVIFLFVFYNNAVQPLVNLNIFSVLFYVVLLWLVFNNKIIVAMLGATIELIFHQVVVVHYIGWGYGFEYFLLVVPSFVLLGVFNNKIVPILLTFLAIAILIFLKVYSLSHQPLYSLAAVQESVVVMNLVFTALPIAFFTGLFAYASLKREEELIKAHQELYNAATFDPLTGLHNRAQGVRKLQDLYLDSIHSNQPYVLAMIDVDNFKSINDEFGHLVGDKVLQGLAKVLQGSFREQDWFFRWGGEEFLVLLPQTDLASAEKLLKKVQVDLTKSPIKAENSELFITITVGFVESNHLSNEQLIKLADQALYQGKVAGKNRLVPAY